MLAGPVATEAEIRRGISGAALVIGHMAFGKSAYRQFESRCTGCSNAAEAVDDGERSHGHISFNDLASLDPYHQVLSGCSSGDRGGHDIPLFSTFAAKFGVASRSHGAPHEHHIVMVSKASEL